MLLLPRLHHLLAVLVQVAAVVEVVLVPGMGPHPVPPLAAEAEPTPAVAVPTAAW